MKAYDSAAEGTGGPDDSGDFGVMKYVDQPEDRGDGGKVAVAGEQRGVTFQDPSQFLLVGGPWHGSADCIGYQIQLGLRVQLADHAVNDGEGITVVGVGALRTSWLARPVTGGDAAVLSASRASNVDRSADSAVPVLAAALERAQVLAALGADRRRGRLGPSVA
ncbi:hypothetical protein [Streptomyces sp. MB09-02B]|uniref:hypothetical protein n=1 Tax=Streptomyces sp. MB09-02B TaxID=3028667 RepID=UPI0029A6FD0A|nr:hypothetical protein [Streptomyces sp. MB09-02B]MDX3639594.1 hypothetical protein [Streptomyces sp. MB09-02B]